MDAVHRIDFSPDDSGRPFDETSVLVVPAPRSRRLESSQRLMAAVLEAAIAELQQSRRVSALGWNRRRERPDAETLRWFASRDRWWPYSFENICDGLGLDAGQIRRRLGIVSAA